MLTENKIGNVAENMLKTPISSQVTLVEIYSGIMFLEGCVAVSQILTSTHLLAKQF